MLELSLVPILGVLMLVGLSIFVQSRRGAKIAEMKAEIERQRQHVLRDDGLNDQMLVDNLLRGIGIDQAISQFVTERARLLPGANPDNPPLWTIDQLENWSRNEARRGVEAINRGLAVPAFVTALLIVSVCVITTTVLYRFHSGPEVAAQDATVSAITSPDAPERE